MANFTSRERVLCALNHQEADRIPVDFGSTRSSGINALAYGNLLKHLNLPLTNNVFDMKQLLSDVDDQVRKMMGGDVIQLHRLEPSMGVRLDKGSRDEILMDGSSAKVPADFHYQQQIDGSAVILNAQGDIIFKRPEDGLYFDEMYHPLAEAESFADIDAGLSLPIMTSEEEIYLKDNAKRMFEETDYAIIGTSSISIFERGFKDFGYENYLANLMVEQEMVEYYLEKLSDAYITVLDRYLDVVGDYIQIIQVNDDYGAQNSLLLSPETFREILKPVHTKIHQFIKQKKPHLKIFFHCCGAMALLLPDLIESGIDIINPIQLSAAGMNPIELKREYGKNVTFWGGACSTQTTMTFKSVAKVQRETKEMIEIWAPGGGFVFCQDHNIQSNVPPENIVAVYEAAKEYGEYNAK
jgi:Uroporphyrinogen-III decarboxylase